MNRDLPPAAGRMLCLNMIVKNEAATLERCFAAVAPHIACWVIGDTGSSDGTPDLIASFFAARGIPGELHHFPFVDFEQARNEALARALASPLAYDYLLFADADMELVVEDEEFRGAIEAPAYAVLERGEISYWDTRLARRDPGLRYRGVTHEYLEVERPVLRLHGLWFKNHASGANRAGKLERDIRLLSEGLQREPDNPRYWFYLAQSYRDAGRTTEAAAAYARRAAMGGLAEEAWYARLQEARCLLKLGDEAGFLRQAKAAFAQRRQRAEPLYDLASYYRAKGQYVESVAFAEHGLAMARPEPDALFLEDYVYIAGLLEEFSIAAYYVPNAAYRARGAAACNWLALNRDVPASKRERARANLFFYLRVISVLLPSFAARRVDFVAPAGWRAMNPSLARRGEEILLTQRTVNHELDETRPEGDPARYVFSDGQGRTRNFLLRLSPDLAVQETAEILPPLDLPPPAFPWDRGFGDLRPFVWRDELWCTATLRELTPEGTVQTVLARIDRSAPEPRLADWRVLPPGAPGRHEKNWMPRVSGDRLQFIYLCDPTRILDESGHILAETLPPIAAEQFCGGSQAIAFDGGWLALVHEVRLRAERRAYQHRFIWLDQESRLSRVSPPFVFGRQGAVEFAVGLTWHPDERRLLISYGIGDREAFLATVEAEEVRQALEDAKRLPSGATGRLASEAASRRPGRWAGSGAAPPVFIHTSWRTSGTWFWSRFRALPGNCCYFEPFQEELSRVTPSEAWTHGVANWDSRHPAGDPYLVEYVPLILKGGGVRLFKPEFSMEWFLPQGGLRGNLRREELRYVALLQRHAERHGSRAVFKFTRSLGRLWAIKSSLPGLHLFLHRNLWLHWLSYLRYKRDNITMFYETSFAIVDRAGDAYFAYLAAHYRARAAALVAHGSVPSADARPTRELLRSLSEPDAFALFMGVHVYLYLHAELVADLTIDGTRLARDAAYREAITGELAIRTGLPISLADAHDPPPEVDAGFAVAAVSWDEIAAHARRAVASLSAYGEADRLTARANAWIAAAREEMLGTRRPGKAGRGTICLSMIVRDEAPVIRRCLASVLPLIDHWVIVDTGSTDGTQEIVRDFLAGIPGELHERPWRDFAHNRSEALALARPHGDYSLVIDADDILEIAPGFALPPLAADVYNIMIEDPPVRYPRAQLARNDKPWRYAGVVHEFLTCKDAGPPGFLAGLAIRRGSGGARRRDGTVFLRDAALLEQALATETDPFFIARYRFYLAQSYADGGEPEKALANYLERAGLGYWDEEIFVGLCRAGRLQQALGRPLDEVLATLARASEACPRRAEAWYWASHFCRESDRFAEGYELARRGLAIAEPAQGLFVESWIYRYGLLDELSINAYWCGRYAESLEAAERLLREGHIPDDMRERIERNAEFPRAKLARPIPASAVTVVAAGPAFGRGRCAVVTPYHLEDRAMLERCIDSVRRQTVAVDHILVADGHPQDWIDQPGRRHIRLDRSHGDYGNTPRATGALAAAAEGYAAIALLDADCWLEPDHIERCLAAAGARPGADYVIARRTLRRPDGTILPAADEPMERHVDTSCFFLLPGAYSLLPVWGLMPSELAVIGDRVFYHALRTQRLVAAATDRATVNHLCLWDAAYRALGETPPGHKPGPPHAALAAWIADRSAPERALIERRVQAPIDWLYTPSRWPPLALATEMAAAGE